MRDEWNENLRCPNCGKTGVASLSQDQEADTPTFQMVPDGFKVVNAGHGPNFHCGTCDIPVTP